MFVLTCPKPVTITNIYAHQFWCAWQIFGTLPDFIKDMSEDDIPELIRIEQDEEVEKVPVTIITGFLGNILYMKFTLTRRW